MEPPAVDDEEQGRRYRRYWTSRDGELDELAVSMVGMTPAEARDLAEQHGVKLRVADRMNVAYTSNYVVGRITAWAIGGTVTRASRG